MCAKSVMIRTLLKPVLRMLVNLRDKIRPATVSTDLVGYETLIDFIHSHSILSVDGDLVEVGTFLGGGAYKLSKFLEKERSSKKLYVIDIFDPTFDWTKNTDGNAMATLYLDTLKAYRGKTQWEVFLKVTKGCNNIVPLKGDSKNIEIPSKSLCFGFIDGCHDPEWVENDFYLIWNRLSPNGAVAFHDYEWDLPQTTAKINELLNRHAPAIDTTSHDKNKHVLFVVKKS